MTDKSHTTMDHDKQLTQVMDNLREFTFSEMTNEQLENCLDKIFEALKIICDTPALHLSTCYVAEIMAILRNLIGLAIDNKNKATLIVANTSDEKFSYLICLFAKCSANLHDSLTNSDESALLEEIHVLTLLRILQVIYNLYNLHFSINLKKSNIFESNFITLFEKKHLRLISGLYQQKHADDRMNDLLQKVCHVFTSNMYNYLKDCDSLRDSFLMDHSQEMSFVWRHILNHVKFEISEYSLWILFLGFKEEQFIQMLYLHLDNDYRLLLLDILLEFVENEEKALRLNVQSQNVDNLSSTINESQVLIPADCVTFMTLQFKSEIEAFLQHATDGNVDMIEESNIRLLSKLSSILLKLSSLNSSREIVQQEQSLLELLVRLLTSIQLLGKSNPSSVFASQGQLKDVTQEGAEDSNPAYGFKANIIGLIANFTYRNARAQDYLRTSDGLAALLDCAKIDARNPFMLQWAIFAIRNALESNSANQQFVAQMHQQGVLKDELVNRINAK